MEGFFLILELGVCPPLPWIPVCLPEVRECQWAPQPKSLGGGQDWSGLFVTLSLGVLGSREGWPLGLSSGEEQVLKMPRILGVVCVIRHQLRQGWPHFVTSWS